MADWFDPLGMRRVADAMSTVVAQALVGREVRLNGRSIEARIVAVEAAPAARDDAARRSGWPRRRST